MPHQRFQILDSIKQMPFKTEWEERWCGKLVTNVVSFFHIVFIANQEQLHHLKHIEIIVWIFFLFFFYFDNIKTLWPGRHKVL